MAQWLRNLPSNSGDEGSISWSEKKDPICCGTTKPMHNDYMGLQLSPCTHNNPCASTKTRPS